MSRRSAGAALRWEGATEHRLGPSAGGWGRAGLVLSGLGLSAVALAAAPVLMPESYSWVANTTSDSAAQGVSGAWAARLGFVLFGLSVLQLAALARRRWGRWATRLHVVFGVLMIAAAAFSGRSWEAGAGFDGTEDLLHSAAATGMGFAFAFAIVARIVETRQGVRPWRAVDLAALAASVLVPLGMSVWPGVDGALQRVMFAVAYGWYAAEAVAAGRGIRRSPRGVDGRRGQDGLA